MTQQQTQGDHRFVRDGKPPDTLAAGVREAQRSLRKGLPLADAPQDPMCAAVFDDPERGECLCLLPPDHPLPHGASESDAWLNHVLIARDERKAGSP